MRCSRVGKQHFNAINGIIFNHTTIEKKVHFYTKMYINIIL